jgi:DNA polymerase III subunit gamma/tau
MSYQVLARKWRPRNFQSMVGQEHTLRMLANALDQKRIHHAYLFTGTRGVGKTTLARILAKCLNCESGVTSTPCETCAICKAINAGQFFDLYEVDAASRTKVEDTRELLENVLYMPVQGRYKIYLIDEVHMLSNHSFNALLKTLEEPPEYVKFLLATTDPKKLPATVLSRCLQFHLKRISPEKITNYLQSICDHEGIKTETIALENLARAADGSMRDALSLLDQAIAYGNGSIEKNNINAMLGCLAQEDLLPLLNALALKDGKAVFAAIDDLAERAVDFQQILTALINILHTIAIAQVIPDTPLAESIAPLANQLSAEDIQIYYQIALLGKRDLGLTSSPQQGFEMTLLRMLAFTPDITHEPVVVASSTEKTTPTVIVEEIIPAPPVISPPEIHLPEWRHLLPKLELSGMAYALASNCTLHKLTENKVELILSEAHTPMLNAKLKERIAESLSRHFARPMTLDIHLTNADIVTPVKLKQKEDKQQLAQATQKMLQDPKIQQLIETYDATVEVSLRD